MSYLCGEMGFEMGTKSRARQPREQYHVKSMGFMASAKVIEIQAPVVESPTLRASEIVKINLFDDFEGPT